MTTLVIARHGNTFEPGEMPRRVGARTDLPLSASGREQAKALGRWMKGSNMRPEIVYSSELCRTRETAEMAVKECGPPQPVFPLALFNEIDYGPDEGQLEDAVVARIGAQALKDWDERAILPPGWAFDVQACIDGWKGFADHIVADEQDCILVVTSNGIARFAPHITGDFDGFSRQYGLKMATGAVSVFRFDNGTWRVEGWNIRPPL